ncbi:tRNA (adenosine(37)-N6)-threonylcarbamoyltransferase complex ATPase subunit type 1 TsaE [Candidatus Babeliales bacterium]|nr:tRNA (adenosine(37)-N6)-threonylcarbamoyltransferase complex ATPase subunit type 1 TsaE [Candidatus Babeliales bacterium]
MFYEFSADQIIHFVQTILVPLTQKCTVFTLTGPLGAGKTTLVKEILRQCGVTDTVTSPTFGYVNSYRNAEETTFHHFDLYRIGSLEEFIDAGFDEYLNTPNSLCFIEWPEVIKPLLDQLIEQKKVCHITLSYDPESIEKRRCVLK